MSRMNLLMALGVAAGVVGCAQCDTCDDFPAPCVGPNCGQNAAYAPPALGSPMMSPGPAPTMAPPAGDAAPTMPDGSLPPAGSAPMPTSPPTPSDPAGRPGV